MNPSKPASPASSQIEAIRRTAKIKSVSIEHTIVDLGIATEVQVAEAAEQQLTSSWLSVDLGNQEFLSADAEELDHAAAPVVTALDHILSYAFEQRASDIHFENAVPAFWPLPSALTGVRTR